MRTTERPLRVTVLAGGPSGERDVSLASGRAIAAALKDAGHAVTFADATPADLSALDAPADVIFPALHGEWGESGELQTILEKRGLAFVGSGSAASRLGMDKDATKRAWRDAALPTPAWQFVRDPADFAFAAPVVVKPLDGGSSLGVTLCHDDATAHDAIRRLVAGHGRCLVEDLVEGCEMTVGVLFDRPLPPIWIDPGDGRWFDYQSKYAPVGGAAHRFDLPPTLDADFGTVEVQRLCLAAHRTIGCRDLSRVDLMIDGDGRPWLLEINTMPGFTGRSLLPDAARHAGLSFADLCDALVQNAAKRRNAVAA